MNLQEIKYDAFISYRHSELDQFVAVNLHKELEAFKLPKAIRKQLELKGIDKKKIERVFRDRDELPITNNLADPITNALRNSEFLLVICSPRLKESLWCRKEIETFISMHGREKVFAVLIEGEPAESFPDELLYIEKTVIDEKGIEQIVKEPVEPLAADVRGKNKKEIRKKIKEEVLRLAAPMFDCSYDDLKQRHRERTIKRIIAIACAISAVFGAFGIISSVMAYRINEQSVQIKAQSEQIQEQADRISEQYQDALKSNAKQMAEDAFDLIAKGDLKEAVGLSYYALTGDTSKAALKGNTDGVRYDEIADMPYTAEAEYALSSALNLYRNGSQIAPTRLLTQESQINFSHISQDMTKMLVVDIFGNLTVYEPLTGDVVYETFLNETYLSENAVCFVNNEEIAYPLEKGFAVYNMETKEERIVDGESISLLQADKNGNYLCTLRYDALAVYDTTTLEPVFTMEEEEGVLFSYEVFFSRENGHILAVKYTEADRAGVYFINIEEGTINKFLSDSEGITYVWLEDEFAYITSYSGMDPIDGVVHCVRTDGAPVWNYECSGMPDHIMAFGAETNDRLVFENYSKLCVLNKETGKFICETDCGREIVNYAAYENSDTLTYMSREGEYHYYMTDSNSDMLIMDKFVTNSDNIKEFKYGNGYYASVAYTDNSVAVYENIIGKGVDLILDMGETPLAMKLTQDEKYLISHISELNYQTIYVVDLEKKEVIQKIETDAHIRDFAVTDENEIVVLHMDSVEGYDLVSGKQTFMRETLTNNEYFLCDGQAYVGDELLAFYICDTKTGETIFTMEDNYLLQNGMLATDIEEGGKWYAYASEENKGIVLGTFENGDARTITVNVKAINHISLAMQEQAVYLTYLDETVEVYDMNTGEFLRKYDNVPGDIEEVLELPEIDQTLLLTASSAYLLNEDKEVTAFLQGFECYKNKNDSFVLSNYGKLYEVPRYTTEEIKEIIK